jgi:hypothetical protein
MEDFAHNSVVTILILVQGQLRACISNRGMALKLDTRKIWKTGSGERRALTTV